MYSAIAANTLNCNIVLISAIGKDYAFTEWFDTLDSSYIKTYNMPTTRFHIHYNKNWLANYIEASSGAGARITSSLIPTKLLTKQNLIHLSPMKPTKVTKIVNNIKQRAPNMEVSISTWIGYTKKARHKQILTELASQVDFFMLNDFELKALTQTSDLPLALERLKARRFVVTLGKFGAITGGEDVDTQMVPALTIPTEKTMDTTGAGDGWNAGLLFGVLKGWDLKTCVTVAARDHLLYLAEVGWMGIPGCLRALKNHTFGSLMSPEILKKTRSPLGLQSKQYPVKEPKKDRLLRLSVLHGQSQSLPRMNGVQCAASIIAYKTPLFFEVLNKGSIIF